MQKPIREALLAPADKAEKKLDEIRARALEDRFGGDRRRGWLGFFLGWRVQAVGLAAAWMVILVLSMKEGPGGSGEGEGGVQIGKRRQAIEELLDSMETRWAGR